MHPNDGRGASNFVIQALRGEAITLYGNGDDLVDGLIRLMDTSHEVTGPINLGNPSEITIKTLAETIIEMTGSKSRIEYRPLPTDDPKQRQPDITRAQSQLDWRPLTPLRAGLKKTIEYFDALLSDGVVQLKKPA